MLDVCAPFLFDLSLDQLSQAVFSGARQSVSEVPLNVCPHLCRSFLLAALLGPRQVHPTRALAFAKVQQLIAVRRRHAQYLADNERGQGQRELRHQVAATSRNKLIDQAVRETRDIWRKATESSRSEQIG